MQDGAKKLHIIADFDGTLTLPFFRGKKIPSLISILRDNDFLSSEYRKKAHELYEKYHGYENKKIPLGKLKKLMLQWWSEHYKLLIHYGLSKKDLEKIAAHPTIQLRKGVKKFFLLLKKYDIPIIILSSSGIGEVISIFLKKKKLLSKNVHVVTNAFIWDKYGKVTGIKLPIIHTANKDEAELRKLPIYKKIQKRKNVILLGNTLEDLRMIKGFSFRNLITIGFINKETCKKYKKGFDVTLPENSRFDSINKLIRNILSNKKGE